MTCNVRYVSPSAIDTWNLCPRRWGFRRLDGIPEPPAPWLDLGLGVHAQHERRYIHGTPYDLTTREGQLADAAIAALPDAHGFEPGGDADGVIHVEFEQIISVDGLRVGGKLDLLHETRPVPAVYDHKTGKPRYFKLEREALLAHPQAPTYARIASVVCGAEEVDLRWNYVSTQGAPRLHKSWHRVTAAEAEKRVRVHLPVVEAIYDAASRFDTALELPYKPESCYAYGRQCHYASRCSINKLEAIMGQPNPFAQGVAAAASKPNPFKTAAAAPAAPPPAAETPPPATTPGPADTSPDDPVNPPEKGRKPGPGRPRKEKPVSADGTVASDGQAHLGTSGTVVPPETQKMLDANDVKLEEIHAFADVVAARIVSRVLDLVRGVK